MFRCSNKSRPQPANIEQTYTSYQGSCRGASCKMPLNSRGPFYDLREDTHTQRHTHTEVSRNKDHFTHIWKVYNYWNNYYNAWLITRNALNAKCDKTHDLTFICPCIANIFSEYNQRDVTFLGLFISVRRSTCFRRFFVHHQELKTAHTASGICQTITATCC